ncbi:MAG: hypothetical protein ACOCU6_02235 [Nanoarchaeota archaeon]
MIGYLDDAGEGLKRAEHLIYVSLKYTRTTDVLLNVIARMINAYEYMIDALLMYAQEKFDVEEIPKSPLEKGSLVKKTYSDQEIHDNIDLFFLLRKLHRAPYEKEQEYRRHVAMISTIDGREEIVNIDVITQYFEFQKQFFRYVVDKLGSYAKEKYAEEESEWDKE